MNLYFNSTQDKVIKIGKSGIITSGRRVYINRAYIRETEITNSSILLHYIDGTIKEIPYSKLGMSYGDVTYEYNKRDGIDLSEYLRLTDKFMFFLINRGCQIDFNTALKEFGINMSTAYISLLKPVYARYMKIYKNQHNLMKIKNNIEKQVASKKLVLYDVPVVIENSKLHLIGNVWIDLTEEAIIGRELCKYDCVSFGGIKKFDKVEIDLDYGIIDKIIFKIKGYY